MKTNTLLIAVLLAFLPSLTLAQDQCKSEFTGLFEAVDNQIQAEKILNTIQTSVEIDPMSDLATRGHYGLGKCFVLSLESARSVELLLQLDFSIAVIGLKSEKAVIWHLGAYTINELIKPNCSSVIQNLKNSAKTSLVNQNAYYQDGFFKLQLPNNLNPTSRKLSITQDGRFLITKAALGSSMAYDVTHVCAFPL